LSLGRRRPRRPAYLLSKEDYIFGRTEPHGEILAKGLSCIYKMEDDELYAVMKNFMGGTILKIVEAGQSRIKDIAVDFLVLTELLPKYLQGNGIP
jgi:2-oxoisovalerate dehydrogenase E1 component